MQNGNVTARLYAIAILLYCVTFPLKLSAEGVVSPDINPPPATDPNCGGTSDLDCFVDVKNNSFDFGEGALYTLIKIALDPDASTDPANRPEFIIDLLGDESGSSRVRINSPNEDPNASPRLNGTPIYIRPGAPEVSKVLWMYAESLDRAYSIVLVHTENSGGGLSPDRQWQIKIKNNDTASRNFYVGVASTPANMWPLDSTVEDEATQSYRELIPPSPPSNLTIITPQ